MISIATLVISIITLYKVHKIEKKLKSKDTKSNINGTIEGFNRTVGR